MCLVIHKPEGVAVSDLLLSSAADYNPHGFGIMAYSKQHDFTLRRRSNTDFRTLHRIYAELEGLECVMHFRYGTSGKVDRTNTHPIRITRDIYMAHSGTLEINRHQHSQSDTWHFANDYLRPILKHRPAALYEAAFQNLIKAWGGPNNKFIFMDVQNKQTVIINREQGIEIEGLWLSSTRWFDASKFHWHQATLKNPAESQTTAFLL